MGCGVQIPKTTQEVGYRQCGQGAKLPLALSTLGPGSSGKLPDACTAKPQYLSQEVKARAQYEASGVQGE